MTKDQSRSLLLSALLQQYDPISLSEMDKVQLMNRVDTKFLIGMPQLESILERAMSQYRVVEIDGARISPYSTIYFDTPDAQMYTMHHNGKLNRYKIRMRSYVSSGDSFLEIKRKNNKGVTAKKRIEIDRQHFKTMEFHDKEHRFVEQITPYDASVLKPQLQNFFQRITLVDKRETERVTLDVGLTFRNVESEELQTVDGLVIVEMKQDGATKSHFRTYLNELNVLPGSMSKYCLGMALVNSDVKCNRFKKKLRKINKITEKQYATIN